MVRGIIFASIVGVIGAALWAAIAYYGDLELGLLAWAIGAGVGFAMLAGAQNAVGPHTGVAALVIALVSIVAGKFLMVEAVIRSEIQKVLVEHEELLQNSDEFAITYVADEVLEEYADAGREITYPPSANFDSPESAADYPTDVWAEAQSRWDAKTPAEQEAVRKEAMDNAKQAMSMFTDMIRKEGFKGSFSFFDILWFGLGGFSAFKLGAGISGE